MIKSFLTTAFRQLAKNRIYTLLNLLGLSVGLACFTLIGLWVKDELNYDTFHSKSNRIYRIASTYNDGSRSVDQAVTPIPLASAMLADLPEVEEAMRLDKNGSIVQLGEKKFIEDGIIAVDPSFFKIFDFRLLRGDAKTALNEPYTILLSESMAKKYFGDADPVGQSIRIFQYDPDGQGADYKITGVVEDCPLLSHFSYNFLFSFKTVEVNKRDEGWLDNDYYTYVLLRETSSIDELQKKFSAFVKTYVGKELTKDISELSYFAQPLADIHLKSQLRDEIKANSSLSYVIIFGSVGFIVLILACINYINLSTAYASDRFKEVGVRKVLGAYRRQLVIQYLMESWVLVVGAFIIAFIWIELFRPVFELQSGRPMVGLYSANSLLTLFFITSLVGLVSGLYPAIGLSSFGTESILKGKNVRGPLGSVLKKGLVVTQFAITVVLITGLVAVQSQLKYINEKDLGFQEENLLIVNVHGNREVIAGYSGFANDLLLHPNVVTIARSNTSLGSGLDNATATLTDADGKITSSTMYVYQIDSAYIPTHRMDLIAGRNLTQAENDQTVILNETAVRAYGYASPQEIIGRDIEVDGLRGTVGGVVKDFHYDDLHHKIEPACMRGLEGNYFSRITVKLQGNLPTGIELIADVWKNHFPGSLLEYSFAEQRIEDRYQSEKRFAELFYLFSFISLALACLGLFALVSFSLKSRTKEIGIRKVLGASLTAIVSMLSKEFLLLIGLSCLLALPIGYYFANRWLEGFVYRINLGFEIGLLAVGIAAVIAAATILIRAVTAAQANPVESLRNE